jgi:hypothetical protein
MHVTRSSCICVIAFTYRNTYSKLPEEALILNSLAMVLTVSAIVVAYIIMKDDFKYQGHILITAQGD